jgi:hypothetical protein
MILVRRGTLVVMLVIAAAASSTGLRSVIRPRTRS